MDYNAFKTTLRELVQQTMGPEYLVSVERIPKNNGVFRECMALRRQKENAAPAVYVKPYFERFKKGVTLEELAGQMIKEYRDSRVEFSPEFIIPKDFETAASCICYRLVNYEKNKEMLKTMPHRQILDLALIYYCRMEDSCGRPAAVLIHDSHRLMWNAKEEELFARARDNTCRILPPYMGGMMQVICDTEWDNLFDSRTDGRWREENMYVLTNKEKCYGAVCFLYPQALEKISSIFESSFYILPSSIHESIIVPDSGQFFPEDLQLIVQDVNGHYVSEEEILSDHVYYYDKDRKILKMEK